MSGSGSWEGRAGGVAEREEGGTEALKQSGRILITEPGMKHGVGRP